LTTVARAAGVARKAAALPCKMLRTAKGLFGNVGKAGIVSNVRWWRQMEGCTC